jgi:hypothetical protein
VPYLLWSSGVTLGLGVAGGVIGGYCSAMLLEFLASHPEWVVGEGSFWIALIAALAALLLHAGLLLAALWVLRGRPAGLRLGPELGIGGLLAAGALAAALMIIEGEHLGVSETLVMAIAVLGATVAFWLPGVVGLVRRRQDLATLRGDDSRPAGASLLDGLTPEDPVTVERLARLRAEPTPAEALARDRERSGSSHLRDQRGRVFLNAALLALGVWVLPWLILVVVAGDRRWVPGLDLQPGAAVASFAMGGIALICAGAALNWGRTYRGMQLLAVGALVGLLGPVTIMQLSGSVLRLLIPVLPFGVVFLLTLVGTTRRALAPGYHPHLVRGLTMHPCPTEHWLPGLILTAGLPAGLLSVITTALLGATMLMDPLRDEGAVVILGCMMLAGGWILMLVLTVRALLDDEGPSIRTLRNRVIVISLVQLVLSILGLQLLRSLSRGYLRNEEVAVICFYVLPSVLVLAGAVVATRSS